ncbi:adenosylmethionine decarboxylase [Burkholderia sp. L27(2015)]|uniref:adenosylmethionine decarboxylase n=1 Tax=Burkholderia sp. L27(2015) TaxID=1641858 RepID=UPI00131C6E4C|nr:adenosylmethionine decarboxylase [Burkholderia sp. L27(2015)]
MADTEYFAYGRHVLVDIEDAKFDVLNNLEILQKSLVSAAVTEGVTVLGTMSKIFEPCGVTILLLLAESHVSLHTYPDQGKAFFDAFTCGTGFEPTNIFRCFAAETLGGSYKITQIPRGDMPAKGPWPWGL